MRVLVVADEESKSLWDHYAPEKLEGVDVIISCGDLSADYLEFLVTMVKCPVLYVPGNHDYRYVEHPPGGCARRVPCAGVLQHPGAVPRQGLFPCLL